ncbi:probable carboxylesterase 1 [Phtheirospermum japonicum]|uniref:Probable carboxylesterase 1 n=1 Tax=Phtheirospermum japonicum TaxID=374723 RepID=A0A830BT87_9LAMI|nr:probable carboxylesterase 1 [Phtheirospermum japonicum]
MMSAKISTLIFFLTLFILSSLSQPNPTNSTQPILYDIYPFIRVYKNGTIQRFIGQDFVPPSPTDPTGEVHSKDIRFSEKYNLSARIYLPAKNLNPAHKPRRLPLLIYFHGGGFFTETAFSATYHNHLNTLVAKAKVVAVSVNYRLAPENPLPIAYQDSWLALKWSFSHYKGNGTEPWLTKYANFGNVYLGGDSAGANIAHNMAIRVGLENSGLDPDIRIHGMFLNCPYFLGKRAIGNESAYAYAENQMERLWLYAYPNSKLGLDDPLANPGMDPDLRRLGCERVLVFVAGNDVLRFRGWYYERELRNSGWNGEVKVVEFGGENHVFNLVKPNSPKAIEMHRMLVYFLNH